MSPCMNFLQSEKQDILTRYMLCMIYSLVTKVHTKRRQPGQQSTTSKRLDIKIFGPLFVLLLQKLAWCPVLGQQLLSTITVETIKQVVFRKALEEQTHNIKQIVLCDVICKVIQGLVYFAFFFQASIFDVLLLHNQIPCSQYYEHHTLRI